MQAVPKASVSIAPSRGSRRGRGRGGRGGVQAAFNAMNINEEENDLFSIVKNCKAPNQSIVDQWIEYYKNNRDAAVTDLVQFFISSCGCKGKVERAYVLNSKYPELIRNMTEAFDEETGDYPLVSTGQPWKRFRQIFCDFVQMLVKQCQYSIIYDQFLMDHVISLLPVLADSQVRAFRHTGTLAAMKITTALVEVVVTLLRSMENINRQYETEKIKRRASDRVDVLAQKKTEYEQNVEEIKNMLAYIFKSVFVHRYRDILPDIRSTCIGELGIWISRYPQMFLDDSYLKYIGWTLYDKVGEVRLKCLQTLLPLYEDEELGSRMELFTSRFKVRIVSMALDREVDAAVCAVKLATYLSKHYRDVLSHKDNEFIYELVYAAHKPLATAAGEYLSSRLFIPYTKEQEALPRARTKRGKQRSPNTQLVRDLIMFHKESQLHEHTAYLVDALIDGNEMIKDWECMTDLLLEEPGREEVALSDKQEKILIDIMTCAVKQSATQESPTGRFLPKKPYTTQKEQNKLAEDRAKISEHFIGTLPLLLQKFIADPDKLVNLLQIAQYFQLEFYTSMRLDKYLDALLSCLDEILDKHIDEEVLANCCKVYALLCADHLGIQQRCQTSRAKKVDSLMISLQNNLIQFREEYNDVDDEDKAALSACFKKISLLNSYHDLSSWPVWNICMAILQAPDDALAIVPDIVEKAVRCCFCALPWELKKLIDAGFDHERLSRLRDMVDCFIAASQTLINSDTAVLRETAYSAICDTLLFFDCHLGERYPALSTLVIEANEDLETALTTFVVDNVFIDAEEEDMDEQTQLEVLHRRRGLLASFCKLVVNRAVSMKTSAEIFRAYGKFFADFGDIIKATIFKARDISKVKCARALVLALTNQFSALKEEAEDGILDPQTENFASLRELAKKFAACIADPIRYREALASMHKEGIDFAAHGDRHTNDASLPPPNLAFLDVLSELTNKLIKQDKRVILQYLTRQISCPPDADMNWQPFILYTNSLLQGEEMPPPQNIPAVAVSTIKKSRGRPPKLSNSIGPFVPFMTSTVEKFDQPAMKRPRMDLVEQPSELASEQSYSSYQQTPLHGPPSFLA